MSVFFSHIRYLDYSSLYWLYQLGQQHPSVESGYLFVARFGIVISFLSFIYLIWTKRINALICSFSAMAMAGALDLLIFLIWKRPRPYIAHANALFPNTAGQFADVSSFPSSHTYIAFAIAVSILLYGHKRLGVFLLIVAVLIAVSRIGAGLHYPSDVIGGALLGTVAGIVAYMLVQKYEKNWEDPED